MHLILASMDLVSAASIGSRSNVLMLLLCHSLRESVVTLDLLELLANRDLLVPVDLLVLLELMVAR